MSATFCVDPIDDCNKYEDNSSSQCNTCNSPKVPTELKSYCVTPITGCDIHKD